MTAFEQALAFVLEREGERSDDANDPGRLTKWGISSRQYPQVLNANFSKDDAIDIYSRDYWKHCGCDAMPAAIGIVVFNAAVNQGQGTAIKLLQRALGVADDGVIGQQTLLAIRRAKLDDLVDEFTVEQQLRYTESPIFKDDGRGWYRRSIKLHRMVVKGID